MPCTKKMSPEQRALYYATHGWKDWGGIKMKRRKR